MAPLAVIEHLDVLEQLGAGRRARLPRRIMHQLDLQRREEALGHGIVPTIAAPARAADDARVGEHRLVVTAGVLPAACV